MKILSQPNCPLHALCVSQLIIFVYLSSLPVARLSDTSRRQLVVKGDSARIQDETTENCPGSLMCTVTLDLGLTSHPKDH